MWILTAILSLLTTNLIFTRALGFSTMMAAAKNSSRLPVLALLMAVFSTTACLVMQIVLYPLGLAKMLKYPWSLAVPLLYTAVIGMIYLLMLLVSGLLFQKRGGSYKKYIHLSAFNCAVMGTLYLAFTPGGLGGFADPPPQLELFGNIRTSMESMSCALLFGLQEGLGFLLAALMLSAVHERLYDSEVPAAFRGFPAVMVYIGIISMAVFAITL